MPRTFGGPAELGPDQACSVWDEIFTTGELAGRCAPFA